MGRRLVALASSDPSVVVTAAIESPNHADLGKDAGLMAGVDALRVPVSATLDADFDVCIDFTVADSAVAICKACLDRNAAIVLGTTGFTPAQEEFIRQASAQIPLVWSPNMSRAVNLTMKLATLAAQVLKEDPRGADVEIIERHHRFKQDAPSGTALRFGLLIAQAMGQNQHRHGREGILGARPHSEIGYHAVRAGDNPGEHSIVFGMLGESIELTVRATNRDCYALGAIAAAKFIHGKPPGQYGMYEVLNLSGR
jgi:4-hydroxy-tetrahydrodipicolinate reductase